MSILCSVRVQPSNPTKPTSTVGMITLDNGGGLSCKFTAEDGEGNRVVLDLKAEHLAQLRDAAEMMRLIPHERL